MAVNQPFDRHFTCSICLNVLRNPVETNCCQTLFCDSCIAHWLNNSSLCPQCKQVLSVQVRPNRILMNILNEMLFKCNFCEDRIRYEDSQRHKTHCRALNFVCPAKDCGAN